MQKQSGITMIGMAVLLSFLAFAVLLALKLTPVYIESFKVDAIMDGVVNEKTEAGSPLSKADVKRILDRRLDIDDVDSVTGKDFEFVETKTGRTLSVKYEVRKPLAFNVDLVVWFDKTVEVAR